MRLPLLLLALLAVIGCAKGGLTSEQQRRLDTSDAKDIALIQACKSKNELEVCAQACFARVLGKVEDRLTACDIACEGGKGTACGHAAGILRRNGDSPLAARYYEKACALGQLGPCGMLWRMIDDESYALQTKKLTQEQLVESLSASCARSELVGCYWMGQASLREWQRTRASVAVVAAARHHYKACNAKGDMRDVLYACKVSLCLQGVPTDLGMTSSQACAEVKLPAGAERAASSAARVGP